MASNADLHRASEMVSSEEDASMGSVWLKGPRRRRFRPNKTHPARTMGGGGDRNRFACLSRVADMRDNYGGQGGGPAGP